MIIARSAYVPSLHRSPSPLSCIDSVIICRFAGSPIVDRYSAGTLKAWRISLSVCFGRGKSVILACSLYSTYLKALLAGVRLSFSRKKKSTHKSEPTSTSVVILATEILELSEQVYTDMIGVALPYATRPLYCLLARAPLQYVHLQCFYQSKFVCNQRLNLQSIPNSHINRETARNRSGTRKP